MEWYFVYILTTNNNKVMYIGIIDDLARRHFEHQSKIFPGFTAKYNVDKLVYYEQYRYAHDASARERQLKGWRREKKNALVETMNPQWRSLRAPDRKVPSLALGILQT